MGCNPKEEGDKIYQLVLPLFLYTHLGNFSLVLNFQKDPLKENALNQPYLAHMQTF
jgi:hypothetical protein